MATRSTRGLIWSALALALGVASASATPYGVNGHIPSLPMLDGGAAAGIEWIRIDLNWYMVEPARGAYDWSTFDAVVDAAEARGLRIYATLGYTPAWATSGSQVNGVPSDPQTWYDFCYRVAQRYRGRVEHFGMWNEPNLSQFWAGSRSQYIDLILKTGARAVHGANPRARVCGPELAHLQSASWDGWLSDVLSRAKDDLDVVTEHIYPSGSDASSVVDALTDDQKYPWEPKSLKEVLRDKGWLPRPVWLTETGYDAGVASPAGESAQAGFVAGLLYNLYEPTRSLAWVDKVFFYELSDDPRFSARWGLLGPPPEYSPKPGMAAYSSFIAQTPVDDAEVASPGLPTVLRPGEQVEVSLVFLNTGTTTWSRAAGYYLAAPGGKDTFATARHDLEAGESVPPGGVATFTFPFLAPGQVPQSGLTFETRWQMAHEDHLAFGELTRERVNVTPSDGAGQVFFLPAMANARGLGGSYWRSDVAILATSPEPAELQVAAWRQGQDNSAAATKGLTVAPGTQRRLENVLESLLGLEGSAALRLEVKRGQVAVAARSYTSLGTGTVSQLVPALPATAATQAGETARLLGLAHSVNARAGFRTNLGLLNPSSGPVTVRVELASDAGARAGVLAYSLDPGGYLQVTDIYRKIGASDVASGVATVRPLTPGGAVLTWASVVDNVSGDSTLVTPAAAADEPLLIVAAAHADGLQGSHWQTDLTIGNPAPDAARYTLELQTPALASPLTTNMPLDALAALFAPDAVASLFGAQGSGALAIRPGPGDTATAFATTYVSTTAGRLGQGVPAARQSDAATFGQVVPLPGLAASRSTTAGYRTNLGLLNVTDNPLHVDVDLYASPSTRLGTLPLTLSPHAWRQITNVFRFVAPGVDDGFALVRTTTPGGRFLVWASVVDNSSGDSLLVPGW